MRLSASETSAARSTGMAVARTAAAASSGGRESAKALMERMMGTDGWRSPLLSAGYRIYEAAPCPGVTHPEPRPARHREKHTGGIQPAGRRSSHPFTGLPKRGGRFRDTG